MPWRGQRNAENCWGDGCGSEPCAENQDGADGLIRIGRKIDKSYPNAAKLDRHPTQYSNALYNTSPHPGFLFSFQLDSTGFAPLFFEPVFSKSCSIRFTRSDGRKGLIK